MARNSFIQISKLGNLHYKSQKAGKSVRCLQYNRRYILA